jgi:hypothetical protein
MHARSVNDSAPIGGERVVHVDEAQPCEICRSQNERK